MQVKLFVLDRLPEPIEEHVDAPATTPVHAAANVVHLRNLDAARGGKLRSLVGFE